jgi:ABC transporter substrate binding protein
VGLTVEAVRGSSAPTSEVVKAESRATVWMTNRAALPWCASWRSTRLPGSMRLIGAQQTEKVPRIGYLVVNLAVNLHLREAFRQGLRDLGYVEGRNLVIEYRDAEGKPERLPALAAELVALKIDVIVTAGGTSPVLAAKQATRTIPIVFPTAADPMPGIVYDTIGLCWSPSGTGGSAGATRSGSWPGGRGSVM